MNATVIDLDDKTSSGNGGRYKGASKGSNCQNKKKLLQFLQQELESNDQAIIPELVKRYSSAGVIDEEGVLQLIHTLQGHTSAGETTSESVSKNGVMSHQHASVKQTTPRILSCGTCEHCVDNRCLYWSYRVKEDVIPPEDQEYVARATYIAEGTSSCQYYSSAYCPNAHASETLGSEFVPDSPKFKKLYQIHQSANPHYYYKELDRTKSILCEFFPDGLVENAGNIIKSVFPPSETQNIIMARLLAAIDLELRVNQATAIADEVYSQLLEIYEITDDMVIKCRRAILQAIPNHPVRREPTKYMFIVLWTDIQKYILASEVSEVTGKAALLQQARQIYDKIVAKHYHFANRKLVVAAILNEVFQSKEQRQQVIDELKVDTKELYNASYRLRQVINSC